MPVAWVETDRIRVVAFRAMRSHAQHHSDFTYLSGGKMQWKHVVLVS